MVDLFRIPGLITLVIKVSTLPKGIPYIEVTHKFTTVKIITLTILVIAKAPIIPSNIFSTVVVTSELGNPINDNHILKNITKAAAKQSPQENLNFSQSN